MGKANKVKYELADAVEMVDLIQTLKDIADNKLYTLTSEKEKFRRFGETFIEFFRLISLASVDHPLISNENPNTGICVISAEGGFLGEFNNKIVRRAMAEGNKYDSVKYTVVGSRIREQFEDVQPGCKVFTDIENKGLYETAVEIKDYLVDEIMNDRLGKIILVYSWPKTADQQRPRAVKLLPCDELVSKQAQFVDVMEKVIEESDPKEIIGSLTNLWITTRIYEILMDTIIASASAQAQFLDDSLDKMEKEREKTKMKYMKAKKGDIDKSLRETFSARMMTMKD